MKSMHCVGGFSPIIPRSFPVQKTGIKNQP
nr:MAG TPA: hypothetical protein [Caudoviricetes sp.]